MPIRDNGKRPWSHIPEKDWGKPNKITDRFYLSPRWKHTRMIHLSRQPLCVMCEALGLLVAGQIVDHIIPRSQGGADCDPSNLQTLCKRHHNIKTKREQRPL
jgi:5-methylcytosine-specific restriction protein A